jgi:hypothetical protein
MPEKTKTELLLEKIDVCLRFGTHLYGADLEETKAALERLLALETPKPVVADVAKES